MDTKEELLTRNLYRRIKAYKFHECDVLALLILLRSHSAKNSPVHELSDFIAHREKDRGALKTYIHNVIKLCDAVVTQTAMRLQIGTVHSADSFRDSLNETFAKFKLLPLDSHVTNDLLACVMSLLQDVRLFHDDMEIGRLLLGRFKKDLWLMGSVTISKPKMITVWFPALIVPNSYCSSTKEKDLVTFPGPVEARCAKGRLRLYLGSKEIT